MRNETWSQEIQVTIEWCLLILVLAIIHYYKVYGVGIIDFSGNTHNPLLICLYITIDHVKNSYPGSDSLTKIGQSRYSLRLPIDLYWIQINGATTAKPSERWAGDC